MQAPQQATDGEEHCIGKVRRMGELYSRFRPQRHEPDASIRTPRHPAMDVPGSRTWAVSNQVPQAHDSDRVTETVTVDAQDLFTQLTTSAYLAKREPRRGLLSSILDVSDGIIRIWRNWLSEQCETKKFSDGTSVTVHHALSGSSSSVRQSDSSPADLGKSFTDPKKEPSVLWINTRSEIIGVKFRVKEKKWRRTAQMPILFESDVEVAVSYEVEFEGTLCPFDTSPRIHALSAPLAFKSGMSVAKIHCRDPRTNYAPPLDLRGSRAAEGKRQRQSHRLRIVHQGLDCSSQAREHEGHQFLVYFGFQTCFSRLQASVLW